MEFPKLKNIKFKKPVVVDSVLGKLDKLEEVLTPHRLQHKAMEVWGSNELLNSIPKKPEWKLKAPNFPMVMDEDGKTKVRADEVIRRYMGDAINPVSGGIPLTQFGYNKLNSLLIDNVFMGYAELSMLTQNSILGRICGMMAEEMWSKGIELKGTGDKEVEENKIKELELELERLDLNGVGEWSAYLSFAFGSGLIYPKLKGDEVDNERENELFIDDVKINKGDLEYLKTIEPTWYVPIKYNTTDPFSEWFYVPEFYTVIGQITHCTRIFKITYQEVVDLLKPVYLFNGIPMLQQSVPWVAKFEQVYDEIISIIKRYNLSVLKTNIEAIIDPNDENTIQTAAANLKNRLDIFNAFRNNMGTLAIANTEEFEQVQMTLTGLDTLLTKSLEYIAIVPGITITKLFGDSLKGGLSSKGEHETNNFYDHIRALQNRMFKDPVTKIIHLAMLNIWGKIDESITWDFAKLEESNKLEESTIRLNNTTAASAMIASGVLTPYDERMRIANDPDSGYDTLAIEEQDLANEVSTEFANTPGLYDDPDEDTIIK